MKQGVNDQNDGMMRNLGIAGGGIVVSPQDVGGGGCLSDDDLPELIPSTARCRQARLLP